MQNVITLLSIVLLAAEARVSIKLIDGSSKYEGTILVKRSHDSKWGLVCDDGWNLKAGNVVCRQLGYEKAKKITRYNSFDSPAYYRILMDDVECRGDEGNIAYCKHQKWYRNDCSAREAAGVVCQNPEDTKATKPVSSIVKYIRAMNTLHNHDENDYNTEDNTIPDEEHVADDAVINAVRMIEPVAAEEADHSEPPADRPAIPQGIESPAAAAVPHHIINNVFVKSVSMQGGRNRNEGYIVASLSNGESGTICSDNWGLREAMVVCKELGLSYADRETRSDFFRGSHISKALYDVNCTGHENSLSDCSITLINEQTDCSRRSAISGVICTSVLPDLLPNITAIQQSVTIQDRYMGYLSCSMEENCLASSAYTLKEKNPRTWHQMSRRLLRFSSSIYNNGTADFRPRQHKSSWQWHSCHMHYHSMDVFTHYDVFDYQGQRVAEGHKASFCLEDVECSDGHRKKYSCRGYGEQGISVGCADVYKHDIDCQWIDITDVPVGNYIFKVNVNPELLIPELDFNNNAAICDMRYTGYSVKLTNCRHSRG